ncbi:MAG: hypothetical protein MAG715_00848 [Methanonatronarchaeales archaeon]|nr:hypothetical protein [Methanonatronarchaeales archaeon]
MKSGIKAVKSDYGAPYYDVHMYIISKEEQSKIK